MGLKKMKSKPFVINRLSNLLTYFIKKFNPYTGLTYHGVWRDFQGVRNNIKTTPYYSKKQLVSQERDAQRVSDIFLNGGRLNCGARQDFFWSNIPKYAKGKSLNVLDVGSGVRPVSVYGNQSTLQNLSFSLNDTVEILPLLEKYFKPLGFQLQFNLLDLNDTWDCIYFGSSLQYFENWQKVLSETTKACKGLVIISDTPFGEIQTFACAQVNTYPIIIPRWIFSKKEITSFFVRQGFSLIHEELMPGVSRFSNYPQDYSSIHHTGLVFSRTKLHL
jgi:putative methyltransferase (TIGR04325 family)